MHIKIFLGITIALALLCAQGYSNRSSEFSGRCSKVYNHQTITVMQGNAALRVRLYDVGNARKPQGATMSSQAYLSSLVLNQIIYVSVIRTAEYVGPGGVVGTVFLNGVNINQKMIDDGYAYKVGEKEEDPEPTFGLDPQPIGPEGFRDDTSDDSDAFETPSGLKTHNRKYGL